MVGKVVKIGLAVGASYLAYKATEWGIAKVEFLRNLSPFWQGVTIAGVGAALGFGVYMFFGKSWILALAAAAFPLFFGLKQAWENKGMLSAPKGAAAVPEATSTKGVGDLVSPEEAAMLPEGTRLEDPTTGEQYVVGDVGAQDLVGADNFVGTSTPLAVINGLGTVGTSTPLAVINQ